MRMYIPPEVKEELYANTVKGPTVKASLGACLLSTLPKFKPNDESEDYRFIKVGNKKRAAHRVAWFAEGREIPTDKPYLDHKCHVEACINVKHLKPASHHDQLLASWRRDGRQPAPRVLENAGQADAIRIAYWNGEGSHGVLAKRFGLSKSQVECIMNGRCWLKDSQFKALYVNKQPGIALPNPFKKNG